MKQCISKFISWMKSLWRTLKEYVCKRTHNHICIRDVDQDGIDDLIIKSSDCQIDKINKEEEENNYDK